MFRTGAAWCRWGHLYLHAITYHAFNLFQISLKVILLGADGDICTPLTSTHHNGMKVMVCKGPPFHKRKPTVAGL